MKTGRTPKWTVEALRQAVAANTTMSGILAALALRKTGGNFKNIRAAITREGIDASHIPKFAEQSALMGLRYGGQNRYSTEELLKTLFIRGRRFTDSHRRYLPLFKPVICGVCLMLPVWQDKPLTLQIDHLDGDRTNNELNNLQWTCPNCHSQTPTWGNKLYYEKLKAPVGEQV